MKSMSPAQPLGSYFNPGQPSVKYDFDPDKAVTDGFKKCVWVFSCVRLLMNAVSSVPFVAKKLSGKKSKDEWVADPEDPRSILLAAPNGDMTMSFMMAYATSHLALSGEAPFKKVRLNDRAQSVAELYPLHPHRFSPIIGESEYTTGYEYYERGARKVVGKDEVIFARLPDPDNILRGCGMLQAAWKSVQADVSAQDWRANIMDRGGIPPGMLRDNALITDEQIEIATDSVEKAWVRASRGGRPMVSNAGTEWIPFSYSAGDLQVLENREFTRDEILNAFGFHPSLFSNDAATYDNMNAGIRHYWRNGAIPLLNAFRDWFNLGLVPKEERARVWIDYDLSGVEALQEDTTQQISNFVQAVMNGISRDEAATITRLPLAHVPGSDVPMTAAMIRPLADVAAGDAGFTDGSEEDLGKEPTPDAPTTEEVVSASVLNGAQVTAATEIVRSVASGEIPRDAGMGSLRVLFNLDESQAEAIMGSAGMSNVPTTPNPNPAAEAAAARSVATPKAQQGAAADDEAPA